MQAADDEHLVKISWSIKGYHAFHIRPPINIDLNIEIENNNRYDENAVLVKIPDLVDLPEHVLNQLPEGSNQRPLRQLAGRPVGRVPANVCKAFKQLLQTQMAKKSDLQVYWHGCSESQSPLTPKIPQDKQDI